MTESTIDMDRAMQGIDCEVITWTNCADEMPTGLLRFIVRVNNELYDSNKTSLNFMMFFHPEDKYEWTPYTPEAWAELNKNIS